MTDDEVIRKAVELADGWSPNWDRGDCHVLCDDYELNVFLPLCQHDRDAIAAQLVRQVDAKGYRWHVETDDDGSAVCEGMVVKMMRNGDDRTMNTLRAIVESKVLE